VKRAAVFAGLVVGWLALLLAPAAPASAHAVLASSTPPANAILTTAPSEVVLTFTEAVRQVPDKIRVIAPDGSRADTGEPTFSGAVVSIAVDPLKPNGTYLVTYRVISADSHPVAGGYTYSVGAPSAPPTAAGGAADEETSRLLAVTIPIVKYVGYGGLVLLVGPTLVLALLWPQRLSRTAPTRLAYVGLGLVAFSTVIELWLQAPYTTGGGYFDGAALRDVLASQFGTTHLIRLAVLIAAAFLLRPVLSGRGGTADRALLAILAIVGLATWPLSGHAGASPVPSVSVVVDATHLAGMAVWLGGLVMLVGFLLPQADERELGAILPVWSRWAALAVAGLFLAGSIQALIEVSTVSALFGTTYGRVIIAKIVLFSVVIAVAAYSRRLVRMRVAASRPFPLRRAIWAELGITAVVLALSASLVQITPARTAEANATGAAATTYYSSLVTGDLYNLQVDVDPAAVGNNSVHLYAYTKDNRPQRVVEWRATAALPSAGIEPLDVPLLPLTDNHASGEINLPTAGQWEMRFTVRISDIDQATVTATVPVK
jgi:copper transport protein